MLDKKRRYHIWQRVVSVLGCIVVFITTYALVLPAITLERTADCGKEAHAHTDGCYTQVTSLTRKELACSADSAGYYDAAGISQYGHADFVVHTHNGSCYGEGGSLLCSLPEIRTHAHDDSCYLFPEAHVHGDSCYTREKGDLTCSESTAPVHTHADGCYTRNLICPTAESDGHHHGDGCYDEGGTLLCTQEETEGHHHGDECYASPLTCTESEEPAHTHTDTCYAWNEKLICRESTDPAEPMLICDKAEVVLHKHSDPCFETDADGNTLLVCSKTQVLEHAHTQDCFRTVEEPVDTQALTCGLEESQEHTHIARCYGTWELTCGLEEHTHTEDCFPEDSLIQTPPQTTTEAESSEENNPTGQTEASEGTDPTGQTEASEGTDPTGQTEASEGTDPTGKTDPPEETEAAPEYLCGKEAHLHEEDCFNKDGDLLCELEEHTHTQECYPKKQALPNRVLMRTFAASSNITQPLDVKTISGSGTQYVPGTNQYTTDLHIHFETMADVVRSDVTYKFDYPADILVPGGLLKTWYPMKDNDKNDSGQYMFDQNEDGTYYVLVQYNADYIDRLDELGRAYAGGNIFFSGTLNSAANENGDIVIDTGKENLTLTIESKDITYPGDQTDRYQISAAKTSAVVDDNKLKYTVRIDSKKGTPDPISFHDQMNVTGATLPTPTVTVEKKSYYDYGGYPSDTGSKETVSPGNYAYADGSIKMDLPGLSAGTPTQDGNGAACTLRDYYEVTYTYDLSGQKISEVQADNSVKVSATDSKTGKTVQDTKTVSQSIDKRYTVEKSGSYDTGSGQIQWTITVNKNHVNITGAGLTDDMLAQLAEGTNVTIEPSGGCALKTDSDGKITGITFDSVDGQPNKNEYKITYNTGAKADWNGTTTTNVAKLDPTPDDPGNDDVITGKTDVSAGGTLGKECLGLTPGADGIGSILWKATLHVPSLGIPAGTTVSDSLTTGYSGDKTSQWMTSQQVLNWLNSWTWGNGDAINLEAIGKDFSFKDAGGTPYTLDDLKNDTAGTLRITDYSFTLSTALKAPNEKAAEIVIQYSSNADLSKVQPGSSECYRNTIQVGEKSAAAESSYTKSGVVKTDGSDNTGKSTTSSDGALQWKVKVALDGADRKSLTVTDHLPKGVVLDKVNVSEIWVDLTPDQSGVLSGTNSGHLVQGSCTATEDGSNVELTITKQDGSNLDKNKTLVLTYDCHADGDGSEALTPGKTYTFTNNVTVTSDGAEFGSAEQTQEWTYQKEIKELEDLSKGGSWDNNNRLLSYTLSINPQGKDLMGGSDVLTLTDTLTYSSPFTVYTQPNYEAELSADLVPSSIKLFRATLGADGVLVKGEEYTEGWNLDYTEVKNPYNAYEIKKVITVAGVPDSTPLIMEYAYTLSSTIRKGSEWNLNLSNNAQLVGTSISATDTRNQDKWANQATGGSLETGESYTFTKVDAGSIKTVLPGAVFSVYPYSADGSYSGDPVNTYTTDERGQFRIELAGEGMQRYGYNTLYTAKETKAPENYLLPDPAPEYLFYFSGTEEGAPPPLTDIPDSAVDLSLMNKQEIVKNTSNLASLTVQKLWQLPDGTPTVHNTGDVSFNLYRNELDHEPTGQPENMVTLSLWKMYTEDRTLQVPKGTTVTITVKARPDSNKPGTPELNVNDVPFSMNPVGTEGLEFEGTVKIQENTKIQLSSSTANAYLFNGDGSSYKANIDESTADRPSGTLVGSYTLTPGEGWRLDIPNLHKSGTDDQGKTVYYTYYVEETSVPTNWTVSYENNNGIVSGVISILNRTDEEPTIELPLTGGVGTALYSFGGTLLLLAGLLLLYIQEKRGKEDPVSS